MLIDAARGRSDSCSEWRRLSAAGSHSVDAWASRSCTRHPRAVLDIGAAADLRNDDHSWRPGHTRYRHSHARRPVGRGPSADSCSSRRSPKGRSPTPAISRSVVFRSVTATPIVSDSPFQSPARRHSCLIACPRLVCPMVPCADRRSGGGRARNLEEGKSKAVGVAVTAENDGSCRNRRRRRPAFGERRELHGDQPLSRAPQAWHPNDEIERAPHHEWSSFRRSPQSQCRHPGCPAHDRDAHASTECDRAAESRRGSSN